MLACAAPQLVLPLLLVLVRPPLHPWPELQQQLKTPPQPLAAALAAWWQLFAWSLTPPASLLVHVSVAEWLTRRLRLVPWPLHWPVWLALLPLKVVKGRPARLTVPPELHREAPNLLLERPAASLLALLVLALVLRWPLVQRAAPLAAPQPHVEFLLLHGVLPQPLEEHVPRLAPRFVALRGVRHVLPAVPPVVQLLLRLAELVEEPPHQPVLLAVWLAVAVPVALPLLTLLLPPLFVQPLRLHVPKPQGS